MASTTPSTTTTAGKTDPKTADFAQKVEKVEKSPTSTQTTAIMPSNSPPAPTYNVTDVYTSIPALNICALRPTTPSTYANSSHLPATGHQKSEPLCAIFESHSPKGSPKHTPIVTGLKTNPETADFIEKPQKIEYLPISSKKSFNSSAPSVIKPAIDVIQANVNRTGSKTHLASAGSMENYPKSKKSPVLESFNWADDANTLPVIPTFPQHPPRDLSSLRSTSMDPFLSLQRRHWHGHPKKRRNDPRRRRSYWHQSFPALHHSSRSHTPFRTLNSLDWDQDPRLADLSNALRALGWARQ